MAHTTGLTNVKFRPGQRRLRARDLQALANAGRAAMNTSFSGQGQHVIVDSDGTHVRQVPQEVKDTGDFMGVVTASNPGEGWVMVQKATGVMGSLRPINSTTTPIKVWVGFNTFLRGPAGNYYDELYCVKNPIESQRGTYPYIGFANVPAFGHVEPENGYSVDQDVPLSISGLA